eukprot:GHRQ01004899.1.p4 GENE.GHRQ01004899.1~~GHRQ01004899.1.p4  ORF type:complete len:114 (-),score=6.35 GHRQ01004899.1:1135-1476(-)
MLLLLHLRCCQVPAIHCNLSDLSAYSRTPRTAKSTTDQHVDHTCVTRRQLPMTASFHAAAGIITLQAPATSACTPYFSQSETMQNCCAVLQVPAGRRHVGMMSLELVGNYAVR